MLAKNNTPFPVALDGHGYWGREKLCKTEMDTNTLDSTFKEQEEGAHLIVLGSGEWASASSCRHVTDLFPLQITLLPLTHATLRARPFGSDDNLSFQCLPALSALLHAC